MLNEILVPECVQVLNSTLNWKEAFDLCMKPLIEKGYVTGNYAESVLSNINNFPNEFVFEDIMIPHAKPEKGVIRSGISILVSKEAFYKTDKDIDIQIMIIMASKSSKEHVLLLEKIACSILNEECKRVIRNATSSSSLYHYLEEYMDDEYRKKEAK